MDLNDLVGFFLVEEVWFSESLKESFVTEGRKLVRLYVCEVTLHLTVLGKDSIICVLVINANYVFKFY